MGAISAFSSSLKPVSDTDRALKQSNSVGRTSEKYNYLGFGNM